MKNIAGLAIDTSVAQLDKKYLGDPESPNFLPDSPLIDRPILSGRQENELKRICTLVLKNVKSFDDSGTDPLSDIIQSLQAQEGPPARVIPAHTHAIKAPAPYVYVPRLATTTFPQNATPERSQPRTRQNVTGESPVTYANDEALFSVRANMDSFSKTPGAACIDYTAGTTNPSSKTSNRTTYSTPATSVGVTPGSAKQRYTQTGSGYPTDEPAPPLSGFHGASSKGESPSQAGMQLRAWVDQQFERQTQQIATQADPSTREFYPMPPPEQNVRQRSRAGSIRDNIKEYLRPGSSAGSRIRPNNNNRNSTHSVMNYIRPGSASGGSIRSTTSTNAYSRSREQWSSFTKRMSRGSYRTNRTGTEHTNQDEPLSFQQESNSTANSPIDLNRPLPALPGLDSYREKPTHIASLMMNPQPPPAPAPAPAVWHSSVYSIISSPNTATTPSSDAFPHTQTSGSSSFELSVPLNRPLTARSGAGFSPLSQSTIPTAKVDPKKPTKGFAKKLGGMFSSSGKKAKAAAAA